MRHCCLVRLNKDKISKVTHQYPANITNIARVEDITYNLTENPLVSYICFEIYTVYCNILNIIHLFKASLDYEEDDSKIHVQNDYVQSLCC